MYKTKLESQPLMYKTKLESQPLMYKTSVGIRNVLFIFVIVVLNQVSLWNSVSVYMLTYLTLDVI